jgi:2-dehydro-3-deoxyglucarate aldolase/4-hydroxy-2-oxoheptanedioate aldolase
MNTTAIAHLRTPRFHLGTWLSLGSPVVAELAGLCGFDWLLLDLEHGCGGEAALFQTLQALRGSRSAVIVRVGAPHPDLIQRVLDWGADGIMVPHVDSAEIAAACGRAARFPPHGTRGYSRSVRACGYGLEVPDSTVQPLLFAQIESAEAVANVRAIAAVDGVDVLFVGPADLAFDLKASGSSLAYDACLCAVAAAALKTGRQAGILNRNEADVPDLTAKGFTLQAVDSDIAIVRQRYRDLVARLGGSSAPV